MRYLWRKIAAQKLGMVWVWALASGALCYALRRYVLLYEGEGAWWQMPTAAVLYAAAFALPLFCLLAGASGALSRFGGERLYRKMQRRSKKGWEALSWREFEVLVAEVFRRHGFAVDLQGGDHADGGIDVIVRRDDGVYLVQCKHWQAQRVGVKVVRELYGVIAAEGMDGGYVVTSGYFTPDAVDFAQGIAMQLINGRQLEDLLDGKLEL